jgi:hypothetical protein
MVPEWVATSPLRLATPESLLDVACSVAMRDRDTARLCAFYAALRSMPDTVTYRAARALEAVLDPWP